MARLLALGFIVACLSGCDEEENQPREYVLVPAGGRITVEGRPLPGAVVTFLQVDEFGTTCGGDVDEAGDYELSYRASPGASAATYKVAVSYKLNQEGSPMSRMDRASPSRDNTAHLAKEMIPPEYSHLGKTTLKATIPPGGGRFDFDLKCPYPVAPVPNTSEKKDESEK